MSDESERAGLAAWFRHEYLVIYGICVITIAGAVTIYVRDPRSSGAPDTPVVGWAISVPLGLLVVFLIAWAVKGRIYMWEYGDGQFHKTAKIPDVPESFRGFESKYLKRLLYLIFACATVGMAGVLGGVGASYGGTPGGYTRDALIIVITLNVVAIIAANSAIQLPDMVRLGKVIWPRADEVTDPATQPDPGVETLVNQAQEELKAARSGRDRWFRWNITSVAAGATFSAAAGVTGLISSAPTAVRLTFAGLALFGAGITALTSTLRGPQRQAMLEARSTGLESLLREVKFAKATRGNQPLDASKYHDTFQRIMAPETGTSH